MRKNFIKRPLGLAALLATLGLLCLPAELFRKSSCLAAGEETPETLTGVVCGIAPGGKAAYLKETEASADGKVLVYFSEVVAFSIGDTVRVEGLSMLEEPEEARNEGQFDAQAYYQTQKTVLIGYARGAQVVREDPDRFRQYAYELREELAARCRLLFGEHHSGVLNAMLLGDKSGLDEETKEIYQRSGMSHLLAISGLHVSIFGMTLYQLLRRAGLGFLPAGFPSMALVIAYGVLTGMSTSTARAVCMFLLAVGADLLGRSYDMLTALAFAALLLLLEQPLYVRSASFLLSFGAVLGIGTVLPALQSLFPIRWKGLEALRLSTAIQLTTVPLVQYFYYELPVYAIFLNLIVIPLMTAVMFSGVAALGLTFLSMGAARIPAFPCARLLDFYEWLGNASLQLPGAVYICGKPAIWQMALYYLGLAAFVIWRVVVADQRKRRIAKAAEKGEEEAEAEEGRKEAHLFRKRLGAAAALLLLNFFLLQRFSGGFRFTMLDVGQGDGLFLRTQAGTTLLIDGGSTDISQVGTYRILPFLKAQGVGRLDYIIVTHTDEDHISGIAELLEQALCPGSLKIGTLLLSEQSLAEEKGAELAAAAEEAGIPVQTLHRGMCLADASAALLCLHPDGAGSYSDKNEASVVLKFTYGDFSLLLTGDLGEAGEEEILEAAARGELATSEETAQLGLLDCDVLKAGHHGSRGASSAAWLKAVTPELTLISCGEDNSYGHPHAETLERLSEAGSAVLVTAETGALTIRSDGEQFWAE